MSNIRTLAALGLDVLKKLLSLCVIKAAKLQALLDNCKLYHDLKRRTSKKKKKKKT